jgi:FdhD protein
MLIWKTAWWSRDSPALVQTKKRLFTSGCGMGLTFTLRLSHYPPLRSNITLTPEQIFPLMQQLMDGATMYKASRGIHAAALSDAEHVLLLAEDVGRHNALDKILGEALVKGIPTAGRILLTSGRISSEMLRTGRIHKPTARQLRDPKLN